MKRWATLMYRRRWIVIITWVIGVIGLTVVSGAVGPAYNDEFTLPDSDSATAFDVLAERFPDQSGDSFQLVFRATDGRLDEPGAAQEQAEAVIADARADEYVVLVTSPFEQGGERNISEDGTIAYAEVTFGGRLNEETLEIEQVRPVVEDAVAADSDVLQVDAGGELAAFATANEGDISTLIAIVAAAIVLAITFGTLVATAVPLVGAVLALMAGLGTITLLSHLLPVGEFTPILASLIGLGVGIDYALFLVSRFRHELHQGASVEDAVATAVNTAGRAVTFAGITVAIALLGLISMRVSFFTGVAIGAAVTVAFSVISAVTFLPAFMGVLGHKIDKVRLRRQRTKPEGTGRWAVWARFVERRPVFTLMVGLIICGILALPLFGMRLAFSDLGSSPKGNTARTAYDTLAEGFGAGFNGPFLVSTTLDEPSDAENLDGLATAFGETDGVAVVTPPFVNEAGDAALITVIPEFGPQEPEAAELLSDLRDDVIPPAVDGTGIQAFVGGSTAINEDFSRDLAEKTPYFIALVVVLSMLLLLAVFRSVVIPIKAAICNFISIAAAFGVIVAIFQWGWGLSLLGLDTAGPIEPFVPAMMFAILFGLSMDYEVFLVSRMHEEWVHKKDNARAIRRGLTLTAGVITAAAFIMIVVYLAFVVTPDRLSKVFGIGLAIAIFIDAFIVRSLIVPSAMHILGKWNWYMPAWLDRIVPKVSIEAEEDYEDEGEADELQPVGRV
jgi:RND superfamily putative drug exporter